VAACRRARLAVQVAVHACMDQRKLVWLWQARRWVQCLLMPDVDAHSLRHLEFLQLQLLRPLTEAPVFLQGSSKVDSRVQDRQGDTGKLRVSSGRSAAHTTECHEVCMQTGAGAKTVPTAGGCVLQQACLSGAHANRSCLLPGSQLAGYEQVKLSDSKMQGNQPAGVLPAAAGTGCRRFCGVTNLLGPFIMTPMGI
jgi:hypothetical protein